MTAPIVWPRELPMCPLPKTVSGTMQPGRHEFQPERGLPIGRPSGTARVDVYSMTFGPLTQAQFDKLRSFHDVTTGMGALSFAMVHPTKLVVRSAQFTGEPSETIIAPGKGRSYAMAVQVMMVDVDPAYAADITLANGFVEYTGA